MPDFRGLRSIPRGLYQRRAWDFAGVTNVGHRKILQGALDACEFNFYAIRKRTGKRVPVGTGDLSRWAAALDENGHAHVHNELTGEIGHLLGMAVVEPQAEGYRVPVLPGALARAHDDAAPVGAGKARQAALGLFWLPTAQYPAGRVEIDADCFTDPNLAREVFLAEGAHAVDYGALTDAQRAEIEGLFEYTGSGPKPAGWFEEMGEETYWRWRGERWMGLFMAAMAPALRRPLENRQPWQWSYDADDVERVRRLLLAHD